MNTILQQRIEEAATFLFKQRGLDKESCRQAMEYIITHQWISVEEDLPKYDVVVIAMEYNPGLSWEDQSILFAHRSKNPDVWKDKNDFCIYPPTIMKITHWMETPILKGDKK